MKKGKIISLIMGLSLILIGTTLFAADGDLIVNGNVGIGTTSPQAKLDVNTTDGWASGALRLTSSNTTGTGLKIMNTDAGGDEWNLISTGSGNGGGAGNLGIYQNNEGYRIYINGTNGNVGIGTLLPGAKLSLASGEVGVGQQNDPTNYLRIGMDSGYTQYLANNAYWTGSAYNYVNTAGYGGTASRIAQVSGTFRFDTASGGTNPITWNNRLYIANNGSVGIGTTNPQSNLHVYGGNLMINMPSGWTDSALLFLYQENVPSNQGKWLFASRNTPNLGFYNAAYGDVMTLLPSGKVGIGGVSPTNILTIPQSSATDPIADSWTIHPCDRTAKEVIRTLPNQSGTVDQLVQIELYEWKRKPLVTDEEIRGPEEKELGAEEMESKRQELSAAKSILPKFQAKRLGVMLDDPNIPEEIIAVDGAGNKGLDVVGYIGWLHATIKELAVRVQELEKR